MHLHRFPGLEEVRGPIVETLLLSCGESFLAGSWDYRMVATCSGCACMSLEAHPHVLPVGEFQLSAGQQCVKPLSQAFQTLDTQDPRDKYLWVQTCLVKVDKQPSFSDHKNYRNMLAL